MNFKCSNCLVQYSIFLFFLSFFFPHLIFIFFPSFHRNNPTMNLDEFKKIFWMEWAHRQMGRFIGLSFVVPGAFFIAKKWVTKTTALRIVGISGLIGVQVNLFYFYFYYFFSVPHLFRSLINYFFFFFFFFLNQHL